MYELSWQDWMQFTECWKGAGVDVALMVNIAVGIHSSSLTQASASDLIWHVALQDSVDHNFSVQAHM